MGRRRVLGAFVLICIAAVYDAPWYAIGLLWALIFGGTAR